MPNYKINFEQVGTFKQGDVVSGHYLGDVNYLLRVGAVEETEEDEKIHTGSVEVSLQIEEAVAKATAALNLEIQHLNEELKKGAPSASKKKIEELKTQVEELTKERDDLKTQVEDLQKKVEELSEEEVTE